MIAAIYMFMHSVPVHKIRTGTSKGIFKNRCVVLIIKWIGTGYVPTRDEVNTSVPFFSNSTGFWSVTELSIMLQC